MGNRKEISFTQFQLMRLLKSQTTTITVRVEHSIKQKLVDLSNDKVCHVSDLIRVGIDHVLKNPN